MSGERFRVLRSQSRVPQAERDRWPESLPWSLVEPWRAQAELEVLHIRGGLAPEELWLAAHGFGIRRLGDVTESAAGEWLIAIAAGGTP